MSQQTGKYIIVAGMLIVIAGVLIYFFHSYFRWIGKLPGDISIEKENFRFYFPVATMILISIIVTLSVNIIKRFL